jgi:hypothetical protein
LEHEAIIGLLDRGLPLIGVLEGIFNSHVDVITGYNSRLQVFYIRDPEHWSPLVIPFDFCFQRYALHDGVIAIIESDDRDSIDFANRWRCDELSALFDLQQATFLGDRLAAESATACITGSATNLPIYAMCGV